MSEVILTGSEHFSVDELTSKNIAKKHGVDNTPTPEVIENLNLLVIYLEDYRKAWGKPLSVTNGYRGKALNQKAGGVPNSVHQLGLAADIRMPEAEFNKFINTLIKAGVKWHTLIIYPAQPDDRNFVHVDIREKGAHLPCLVREWKLVNGKDTYPIYTGHKK